MKYLKLFNQASEYEAFKVGDEYVTPNVSYVVENTSVKFNPNTIVVEPLNLKIGEKYPELLSLLQELYNTYYYHIPTGTSLQMTLMLTDGVKSSSSFHEGVVTYNIGDVVLEDTTNNKYEIVANIKSDKRFAQLFNLYLDDTKLDAVYFMDNGDAFFMISQPVGWTEDLVLQQTSYYFWDIDGEGDGIFYKYS